MSNNNLSKNLANLQISGTQFSNLLFLRHAKVISDFKYKVPTFISTKIILFELRTFGHRFDRH